MEQYLIGIDLGTTGCKAMLFDTNGQILSSHYIEYGLLFTPEGVEQDAEEWWRNTCLCVSSCVRQSGVDPQQITALSISSQGIAGVPVDANGQVLYNALSWLDNRSTEEQSRMRQLFGFERIRQLTGKNNTDYSLPQLWWIKRQRPEVYAKTDKYLMPLDFLIRRMTDRSATDFSMASGTLAFDVHHSCWIQEFFDALELPADLWADLLPMGTAVGSLTANAAEAMGLPASVTVVMGAQDQRCAALGAGIEPGVITISLGTAAAVCSLLAAPTIDPEGLVTCCGMDGQSWMAETTIGTTGAALKWLRNTCFAGQSYDELNQLASQAQPGAGGLFFLPLLNRGKGGFFGLRLETTPGDMVRAVMEGVAYIFRHHIENHERLSGPCRELRIFGGGSNSPIWLQIIADVTGKRVVRPQTHETACLGAAILAAKGAGLLTDIYHAEAMTGAPSQIFTPNSANELLYTEAYRKSLELSDFIDKF